MSIQQHKRTKKYIKISSLISKEEQSLLMINLFFTKVFRYRAGLSLVLLTYVIDLAFFALNQNLKLLPTLIKK